MDFWVIVSLCVLVVVAGVLVAADAFRLFVSWGRFAQGIAASRPDAVVVLAQMRPDLPRQLRMLTGDDGIRDPTSDDTGLALVVDGTTLEVYRDPARQPVFSCPTGDLTGASAAEHTALSAHTGKAIRTYPCLRLTLRTTYATGTLDLVPLADPRLSFLAAKPARISDIASRLQAVAGLPGTAAS